MSKINKISDGKTARQRYSDKTLKITFNLNIEETKLAEKILEKEDLKHNQLAKKLFLEYLKNK